MSRTELVTLHILDAICVYDCLHGCECKHLWLLCVRMCVCVCACMCVCVHVCVCACVLHPQMYISKLARALGELTTRRIVMLVLVVVIVTPFLDPIAGSLGRSNEGARLSALTTLHR